jgi:hypothetical protein
LKTGGSIAGKSGPAATGVVFGEVFQMEGGHKPFPGPTSPKTLRHGHKGAKTNNIYNFGMQAPRGRRTTAPRCKRYFFLRDLNFKNRELGLPGGKS